MGEINYGKCVYLSVNWEFIKLKIACKTGNCISSGCEITEKMLDKKCQVGLHIHFIEPPEYGV